MSYIYIMIGGRCFCRSPKNVGRQDLSRMRFLSHVWAINRDAASTVMLRACEKQADSAFINQSEMSNIERI